MEDTQPLAALCNLTGRAQSIAAFQHPGAGSKPVESGFGLEKRTGRGQVASIRYRWLARIEYGIQLAPLLLTACASGALTQVRTFSVAAQSVVTEVQQGYALLDATIVDRKIYDVAADTNQVPMAATFDGVLKKNERLTLRLAVLSAVGDYAGALEQLAQADVRQEVDASSRKLYQALSGLRKSFQQASGSDLGVTDQDLTILSMAVDAIESAVLESRRRAAVRTVVIKVNSAVQKACRLVAEEMKQFGPVVSLELRDAESSMLDAYKRERQNMDFTKRLALLHQIHRQHQAAAAAEKFFADIAGASAQLGKTHATLKAEIEKGRFGSGDLAKDIGQLVDFVRPLKGFYDSLNKP